MKNWNTEIDNLQSMYSNLTKAQEEYTENGYLTMDNLQSILSLEPQYVAMLIDENGQININKESLYNLTQARLEDYKAMMLQEAAAILLDVAEKGTESTYWSMIAACDEQTKALEMTTRAELNEAKGKAIAKIETENGTRAINNYIDALDRELAALDNFKGNLTLDNYDAVMGGGNKKKDKDTKKYDDEFDRYHDIHNALKLVEDDLTDIERLQKHLHGRELIKSLQQENDALDRQAGLYEQLAAAQQQEAAELREKLSVEGLMFDASGAISNYAAATAQALEEFNQAVTNYNRGLITESQYTAAEKRYEDFKKQLERYETLYYDEMIDTQNKLADIRDKQLENNFKSWETEIQVQLDFAQMERQWNDFLKKVKTDFRLVFKDLGNEFEGILKNTRQIISKDGDIKINMDAISEIEREIDAMMGGGQSDMFASVSEAQEALKTYMENLQGAAEELQNLYEDAWDALLEGIDQGEEKLEDIMDAFKRIDDELEFQGELIELLYGEKAYGLMDKLYKAQEQNSFEEIRSLKQRVDLWKEEIEKAEEGTEEWQKINENLQEAQDDLNDKVIDYINLLKDDYANAIDDILYKFEKFTTGGTSLDNVATQWDRIQAKSDKYYDSIEGLYEVQKLANDIQESIVNTDDLTNKQKLQKLYDKEINYLREKESLTEYDIQAAEARYQIALKEIALEEAQNNKTSMKLTRGDDGNWSYQYVADDEDVMSKQQELLDAYQKLYDLAKNAYQTNLESLQSLQTEYIESSKEIYLNDTLTEEERQAQLAELRQWYLDEYKNLAEENQLYRNDLEVGGAALLLELYNQDLENYQAMNNKEQELLNALLENSIDGYAELEELIIDNYDNMGIKAEEVLSTTLDEWTSMAQEIADIWNGDGGDSVKGQVTEAMKDIQAANDDYINKINILARTVERDFGQEGIAGAILNAQALTESLAGATEDACDDISNGLDQYRDALDEVRSAWEAMIPAIVEAISRAQEYLRLLGEVEVQAKQAMADVAAAQAAATQLDNSKDTGHGLGNKTSNVFWSQADSIYAKDPTYRGSTTYQGPTTFGTTTAKTAKDTITREEIARILHHAVKYDTGGYTGEWSDNSDSNDGKLAFLHKKELVLNQSDTSNILKVVDLVRSMESSLLNNLSNKTNQISTNNNAFSTITNNDNTSGNTFYITAEFTEATSADEIREALMSLPNLASQYVNR